MPIQVVVEHVDFKSPERMRQTQDYIGQVWDQISLPAPDQYANWRFHAWNETLPVWETINDWNRHRENVEEAWDAARLKFAESKGFSSLEDLAGASIDAWRRGKEAEMERQKISELEYDGLRGDALTPFIEAGDAAKDEFKINVSSSPETVAAIGAFDQFKAKFPRDGGQVSMAYFEAAAAVYFLRLSQILSIPELREKLSTNDVLAMFRSIQDFHLYDVYPREHHILSEQCLTPHQDRVLSREVFPLVEQLYDIGFEVAKTPDEVLEIGGTKVGGRFEWQKLQGEAVARNLEEIAVRGDIGYEWVEALPARLSTSSRERSPLTLILEIIGNIPKGSRSDANVLPLLASMVLFSQFLEERAHVGEIESHQFSLDFLMPILGEDALRKAFHLERIVDEPTAGAAEFAVEALTEWDRSAPGAESPRPRLRLMPTDADIARRVNNDKTFILRVISGRLKAGVKPEVLGSSRDDILKLIRGAESIPPLTVKSSEPSPKGPIVDLHRLEKPSEAPITIAKKPPFLKRALQAMISACRRLKGG